MTETFKMVQNALRNAKECGVDLTHPMGATIGGKTYPATDKSLFIDNRGEGHYFLIPLENRHQVLWDFNSPFGTKTYAGSYVLYPTEIGGWWPRHRHLLPVSNIPHRPKSSAVLDDVYAVDGWGGVVNHSPRHGIHYPPFDSFHIRAQEYASEKNRGVRIRDGLRPTWVPDDELQEHYQIGAAAREKMATYSPSAARLEQMRRPHIISVHYDPAAHGNQYKMIYNVKTEQLTEQNNIDE
jgi:hypothetical protein